MIEKFQAVGFDNGEEVLLSPLCDFKDEAYDICISAICANVKALKKNLFYTIVRSVFIEGEQS